MSVNAEQCRTSSGNCPMSPEVSPSGELSKRQKQFKIFLSFNPGKFTGRKIAVFGQEFELLWTPTTTRARGNRDHLNVLLSSVENYIYATL